MNADKVLKRVLLTVALIVAMPCSLMAQTAGTTDTAKTLPADSLYWLSMPLTDSQGKHFKLRDLSGHLVLVSMFYGDCNTACPIVLENLQRTIAAVQPRDNKLTVLMISLNPTQDTPASLAKLGESHHLDKMVFRLSISDNDAHTRAIASALGVKYRVLGGGEINHSTRIVLLDATGRIIASSTQLGAKPDQDFLKQIRSALKPS